MLNIYCRKLFASLLAILLCGATLTACGYEANASVPKEPQSQSNAETSILETSAPATEPTPAMDWTVFETIGVSSSDAETIFTTLGFTYLTDLQPIGTSTINYQLYPFGIEGSPINIMVEDGIITQVALRNLWVTQAEEDAYFNDEVLPTTWYYEGESGYYTGSDTRLGLIMYDIYMYDNAYYIGVNWEEKQLFYIV